MTLPDGTVVAQSVPKFPPEKIREIISWVKSCTTDSDPGGRRVCFTASIGEGGSEKKAGSAIIIQRDDSSEVVLRAAVPLGMQTPYGTRVYVDKQEPLRSPYVTCSAEGCFSDYILDGDAFRQMRAGKNLVVQAIGSDGKPVTLLIPLADFDRSFEGPPKDWSSLDDKPKKLLDAFLKLKATAKTADTKPIIFAPWTKFCLRSNPNAKEVCSTGRDGRNQAGQAVVAAVLIEPQGEPKKILRITLPLNMQLGYGTHILIDDGAPQAGTFLVCLANGCMSDFEATPELLANLAVGRFLVVQSQDFAGRSITQSVALDAFRSAHEGPPTDPKEFERSQRKMQ